MSNGFKSHTEQQHFVTGQSMPVPSTVYPIPRSEQEIRPSTASKKDLIPLESPIPAAWPYYLLAEQFLARIPRDGAELVVHKCNAPLRIRDRNDGMFALCDYQGPIVANPFESQEITIASIRSEIGEARDHLLKGKLRDESTG
jgi:hypothetical protein